MKNHYQVNTDVKNLLYGRNKYNFVRVHPRKAKFSPVRVAKGVIGGASVIFILVTPLILR